jgi:hypothetical protein
MSRARQGAWSVVAALALAGCGASPVRGAPVVVPGAVKRLVLDVDHGNVEIVAAPDVSKVEIVRTNREAPGRDVEHEMKDGVLQIVGKCGQAPKCKINHRIRVPPTVAVTVTVRDGDVALMDVGGDVDVDVGLGNVSGIGLTGANIEVSAEGGNVDIIFAAAPQALHATVAAGDIDLRVPAGAYRCELDKKALPQFGVKCEADAAHLISAVTTVGRLSVHASD